MAKLLLDCGADVFVDDNYPLRLCIEKNSVKIAKLLLDCGANLDDYDDTSLLMCMSDEMKILLDAYSIKY